MFASVPQLGVWLTGIGFLIPAVYLFFHDQLRFLSALMILFVLILLWMRDRTLGICGAVAFLLFLGDIRRIMDEVSPAPAGLDVFLLLGPIMAMGLALPLLLRLKVSDSISRAVLALMAIMFLEIFNPRQGSLAVGVGGALFFIVPLLWFWIARHYANDRMMYTLLYKVCLPIGILDAMLGIVQTYIGFFPWEKEWAVKMGPQGMFSTGHLRAFGFSTSALEFSSTMIIAAVIIVAALFAGRRAYVLLLPILLAASIIASSRGLIVKLVFAIAVMWAIRNRGGKNWVPRFLFALIVGFGLTYYSASHAQSDDTPQPSTRRTTAQMATEHLTQGLSDPAHSTATLHWQIFYLGIWKGFTYPIGRGLGATTLAAGKFSEGESHEHSSEIDISDTFISLGFVGGFIYVFIIFQTLRAAFRYLRSGPHLLSFAYIGILSALFGSWISLGQYAIAPVVWFCIGSLAGKPDLWKGKEA